jgi:cytochrome c peroxidase
MHDGSLKTLEDVVEFYDKGGLPNRNQDEKIRPLKLTDGQKKDLVEFLKSLSGDSWQKIAAPAVFPQ